MGDHRACSSGTSATTLAPTSSPSATSTASSQVTGRRVARHAAEQRTSQPYIGRRVTQVTPAPVEAIRGAESLPYAGRRVAGRTPAVPPESLVETAVRPVGRRIALDAELTGLTGLAGDAEDVVGHLLRPTDPSSLDTYVGRRVARPVDLITEPIVVKPVAESFRRSTTLPIAAPPAIAPIFVAPIVEVPVLDEPGVLEPVVLERVALAPIALDPIVLDPTVLDPTVLDPTVLDPIVEYPIVEEPIVEEPIVLDPTVLPFVEEPVGEEPIADMEAAELVEPVLAAHPELTVEPPTAPAADRVAPKQSRLGGRRVAARRPRVPSLPLLAGVAVIAISAGGALQAVNPGLAGANADGHLSPASALSGSSAVGSASLLGGRGATVSRDSDRSALSGGDSLQAAADQQAKERDAALSALAGQAEKKAAEIKLHQWVLPVTPGVYHLTARFGDYSSLWSHFHTGLDFAAPTGTPIMAVAGGTITEVGYSGAYGNRTIETLPDGSELWYCHQNSFGTSVGAIVKPGQVIGYIGSTGNVTGPHLHLEVHPGGGDPVDPYTALQVHGLQP
jgi:murein DD-endopeptidase MepM/ murein hydrolase activator NlpD